jgi:hypothetical protein
MLDNTVKCQYSYGDCFFLSDIPPGLPPIKEPGGIRGKWRRGVKRRGTGSGSCPIEL